MTSICKHDKCYISRRHIHTQEMEQLSFNEYWCPTHEKWTRCEGPCPNGEDHVHVRQIYTSSEKIILL